MKSILINNHTYRYADQLEELSLQEWQTLMSLPNETQPPPDPTLLSSKSLRLRNKIGYKSPILQKTDSNDCRQFLQHWKEQIIHQTVLRAKNKNSPKPTPSLLPQRLKRYNLLRRLSPLPSLRPLETLSAQAFCDASDLYLDNYVEHAPLIVAILSLRNFSNYNDTHLLLRAERMKRKSMKFVLKLFDELIQAHQLLKHLFPDCYQNRLHQQIADSSTTQATPQWNDLLLWLANYRPSEIKLLKQLPCYAFMRIVNAKIQSQTNGSGPSKPDPSCIELV